MKNPKISTPKPQVKMKAGLLKKAYKVLRILLLVYLYKITPHQYLSSYSYAVLKQTIYEWSKFSKMNEGDKVCLWKNTCDKMAAINKTSCLSCETITDIPQLYYTSFDEVEFLCIRQNKPVLVTDVMFDWSNYNKMTGYKSDLITEIFEKPLNPSLKPCYHSSSIQLPSNFIADFWNIIANPSANHWFFTLKNCDLEAAKSMRHLYEQPYFLRYFLPASQVNWIIASANYQSTLYKEIDTETNKLLVLMQLRGALNYRLQPRKVCSDSCNKLQGTLGTSQTLILHSDLWEVRYLPNNKGINLSVMTEYDLPK